MARRKVDNLLALAVLSYLSQTPMHPYELGRTLREHGDDRSIKFNHGSLYMVVQQLARAGFIEGQEATREGNRPERTVYALTDTGRAELRDWLRELVEVPRHEFPAFVAALSLVAALPPSEVIELLGRRLEHLAGQQAQARALVEQSAADGVPPLFLIEEEYRLTMLAAESGFVSEFIERIQDPVSGWGKMWAQFYGEDPAATGNNAAAGDRAATPDADLTRRG
ncbi:MAG TPA: PadR family transcriptional regulator [Streptosporangiaceae bacterium]|jgi:DNA-binding PadR family transcriptional regulator